MPAQKKAEELKKVAQSLYDAASNNDVEKVIEIFKANLKDAKKLLAQKVNLDGVNLSLNVAIIMHSEVDPKANTVKNIFNYVRSTKDNKLTIDGLLNAAKQEKKEIKSEDIRKFEQEVLSTTTGNLSKPVEQLVKKVEASHNQVEKLFKAIEAKDAKAVGEILIASGNQWESLLEAKNKSETPMHAAVRLKNPEVVTMIREVSALKRALYSKDYTTALLHAIKVGNIDEVKDVLNKVESTDINKPHLEAAIATGDSKLMYEVFAKTRNTKNPHANKGGSYIDEMIDFGIKSGMSTVFDVAVYNIDFAVIKDSQIIRVLESKNAGMVQVFLEKLDLSKGHNLDALIATAIKTNNHEIIKMVLTAIGREKATPHVLPHLSEATYTGNEAMVKLLFDHTNIILDGTKSAIRINDAINTGNAKIVKMVLERSVLYPRIGDLENALKSGNSEIFKTVYEFAVKGNPNIAKEINESKLLDKAVKSGNLEMVKVITKVPGVKLPSHASLELIESKEVKNYLEKSLEKLANTALRLVKADDKDLVESLRAVSRTSAFPLVRDIYERIGGLKLDVKFSIPPRIKEQFAQHYKDYKDKTRPVFKEAEENSLKNVYEAMSKYTLGDLQGTDKAAAASRMTDDLLTGIINKINEKSGNTAAPLTLDMFKDKRGEIEANIYNALKFKQHDAQAPYDKAIGDAVKIAIKEVKEVSKEKFTEKQLKTETQKGGR